ncbi:MAG: ATP-binding protein [Proteobacteria bacterium]|nr:ATP-binding protein [Pseudomonadota bacterium]
MHRHSLLHSISQAFRVSPVVALLGPRQSGKTTLARTFSGADIPDANYFDLEEPQSLQRLSNPMLALEELSGLVVIDEIQRAPDLFQILRVLVDRRKTIAQFLILGSASRDLIRQSSESLAGRITYIEVPPFSLPEVGSQEIGKLHLWGGFPPSFLAGDDALSAQWRESYIRTFLERDIPALGIRIPAQQLRRFWTMLAHYHAQILNQSEIGASFGVAHTTVSNYVDILTGTFMVRRLNPWFENISKRQVKRPRIYFRDSGILHRLIGINSKDALLTHPKLGSSWEGFALEQVIRTLDLSDDEIFFWQVHEQIDLDLLVIRDGKRVGFEFKFQDAPRLTKSMTEAEKHLGLESLTVIYPGKTEIKLTPTIKAIGLGDFVSAQEIRPE